ncbi:MAG TPA: hypothetical protein VLG38_01405 [Gammaproteobacteria bacterium]|nr:hypothetical protein [Gammaproteobacteria bacterium]
MARQSDSNVTEPQATGGKKLPDVDVSSAIMSILEVNVQDELYRLQGIKKGYNKLLESTNHAINAKEADNAIGMIDETPDVPAGENLLEWDDDSLSFSDLKKKLALLEEAVAPIEKALKYQQASSDELEIPPNANLYEMQTKERKEFKIAIEQMPAELQVLKVLFEIGARDQLIEYLDQYHELPKDNRDAYAEFLVKVTAGVDQTARTTAIQSLMGGETGSTPLFKNSRHALAAAPAAGFKKLAKTSMLQDVAAYIQGWWNSTPAKPATEEDAKIKAELAAIEEKNKDRNLKHKEELADLKKNETATMADVEKAAQELRNQTRFADLSPDDQQQLIEQRMFIIKLNSYLQLSDIDHADPLYKDLDQYYSTLRKNIDNALTNERDLNKSKEDFVRIKAEIDAREGEIATKVFRSRFYTTTNVKAAGAVMTGIGGVWWAGPIGQVTAVALAGAAIGGFYKDAADQGRQVAAELVADDKKVVEELASSGDVKFIQEMDEFFSVKTGKEEVIPEVEQTVLGQIQGAGAGAMRGAQEGATYVGGIAKSAAMNYLRNNYPKIAQMIDTFLEYWTPERMKRMAKLVAVILPILIITSLFPPLWPVFFALSALIVVSLAAWAMGVPVARYATNLMEGASALTQGITNGVNFLMRPMFGLAASLKQGNTGFSIAAVGVAVLAAIAGAVLLPLAFPAFAGAALVGGIAGAYLGLSATEIVKNIFVKPMQVAIKTVEVERKIEATPEMTLSLDQRKVLNELYPKFDEKLMNHFKSRHDDLIDRIKAASAISPPDPELVDQIAADVKELEANWIEIKQAINDLDVKNIKADFAKGEPPRIFELLSNYARKQYAAERESFMHSKPKPYTERQRQKMMLGATESATKATPVGAAPSFKMDFAVDYEAKRDKIQQLKDLSTIVQDIEKRFKYKARDSR